MFSKNFSHPDFVEGKMGQPWLASVTYVQAREQPDWSFYMHTHDASLEISFVLNGMGSLYCGGKFFRLRPGSIVIKNPGIQHAENSDPEDPIEQICLLINGLQLPGQPENVLPTGSFSPVVSAHLHKSLLEALTRDMLASLTADTDPDMSLINRLLHTMLCLITDEIQNVSVVHEPDENGPLMEQIRVWIDQHYMKDLSLDAIADHFHISIYYLARQFKKHTGITVNQYLTSCRIGEAQRSLIFRRERIDAIADKCGFSNLSYFYTTFRKKVGCTPAEYKKLYSKTV